MTDQNLNKWALFPYYLPGHVKNHWASLLVVFSVISHTINDNHNISLKFLLMRIKATYEVKLAQHR